MRSGLICQPPTGHVIGGGASAGLPAGASASAHLTSVSISAGLSERSLRMCPEPASANQGRHLFRRHRRLHRTSPGARGLIGLKRHRRDLARPVTRLAVLLQQRHHILVERHWSCGSALRDNITHHGSQRDNREPQHRRGRHDSSRHLNFLRINASEDELRAELQLTWCTSRRDLPSIRVVGGSHRRRWRQRPPRSASRSSPG